MKSQRILAHLVRQFGWSLSKGIREGFHLLGNTDTSRRRIAGLGKFSSGIADLGSNKKHLESSELEGRSSGQPRIVALHPNSSELAAELTRTTGQ